MRRNHFLLFLCLLASSYASCQTLEKKDTAEVRFLNSRKFYLYKVEKGETLFSISQKFKIPQEEITEFNPDIKNDGLKAKMKLWIPAYSWVNKDSAGSTAKPEPKSAEKKRIKIAVITALNLPKQYLEKPVDDSTYVDEPLDKDLKLNIEFVESIRFALEKNSTADRKFEIFLIDDESDSVKVGRALRTDMDLSAVITNETGPILRYISSICQNRNIRLFSTGVNTTDWIKNNKFAVSLLPSSLTQCQQAGYFASAYFPNSTAIFIKTSNTKESERSQAFKEGWSTGNKPIIQCDYAKNQLKGVTDSLSRTKNMIVFVPSSNEDMVTSMLSSLKEKKDTGFRFSVIGLPTWQSFETVDPHLMEADDVHFFNSGQVNYNSNEINALRKHFREKFNNEPGETAVIAMDAVAILVHAIDDGGKDITETELKDYKGLFTDYHFAKSANGSSLENKIIHIYKSGDDDANDLSKKIVWK